MSLASSHLNTRCFSLQVTWDMFIVAERRDWEKKEKQSLWSFRSVRFTSCVFFNEHVLKNRTVTKQNTSRPWTDWTGNCCNTLLSAPERNFNVINLLSANYPGRVTHYIYLNGQIQMLQLTPTLQTIATWIRDSYIRLQIWPTLNQNLLYCFWWTDQTDVGDHERPASQFPGQTPHVQDEFHHNPPLPDWTAETCCYRRTCLRCLLTRDCGGVASLGSAANTTVNKTQLIPGQSATVVTVVTCVSARMKPIWRYRFILRSL